MSIYTVTGAGPCIASQSGMGENVTVQNVGSKPVYLNRMPGIITNGFYLAPSGSKEWPAGDPLYIQCENVGDTTTVSVGENAGAFFTPGPINSPGILFACQGATCIDASGGLLPSYPVGGTGDQFQQGSGARNGVTDYIDCMNYNSIHLVVKETGLAGVNFETRPMSIRWYIRDRYGNPVETYRNEFRWFAISGTNIVPQLESYLPVRGDMFRLYVDGVSYSSSALVNTLDVIVQGDTRVLQTTRTLINNGYWVGTEKLGGSGVVTDLVGDSYFSLNRSFPASASTNTQMSSIAGPMRIMARINTAAATATTTRVQIATTESSSILYVTEFVQGRTGIQTVNDTFNAPNEPILVSFVNGQAVATQLLFSMVPEQL